MSSASAVVRLPILALAAHADARVLTHHNRFREDHVEREVTATLPVVVRYRGQTLESNVSVHIDFTRPAPVLALRRQLEAAVRGPIAIGGQRTTERDQALLVYGGSVIGPPGSVRDIDYVVSTETLRRRADGECRGYRIVGGPRNGERTTIRRQRVDQRLSIVDVRSGQAVATREFEGTRGRCPDYGAAGARALGHPAPEPIYRWLREFLGVS